MPPAALDDPGPHKPAAAYSLMAALLPQQYLFVAPPPTGVVMYVQGMDGNTTCWAMASGLAHEVQSKIQRHPALGLLRVEHYKPKASKGGQG